MEGLLKDLDVNRGDNVVLWMNGYSITSQIELSIMAGKCCDILREREIGLADIQIERLYVTPGAAGLSLSMLKMNQVFEQYYKVPAYSPFFKIMWKE